VKPRKRLRIERRPKPRKLTQTDCLVTLDGHEIGLSNKQALLLSHLFNQLGRAIPYHDFGDIVGADCRQWKGRHLLATFMTTLRDRLRRSGAPYVLATSRGFAYALCELAPKKPSRRGKPKPRRMKR
jgi:DNA-binding response OmpR family regulator